MRDTSYGTSARKLSSKKTRPAQQKQGGPQKGPIVIAVGSIDYTALLAIMMLVLIGVVMVFSASYHRAMNTTAFNYNMFHFFTRQGLFAVMGFCVMMLTASIHYRTWLRFTWHLYLASIVLLGYVAIFSEEVMGARRWMALPLIGSFQPSELAKIAVIFATSYIIYRNKNLLKNWAGFLFCCALVGVLAVFVLFGSFSAAIIISLIGFGIIFIASPHVMRFVVGGVAMVGGVVSILMFGQGFRSARFEAWLDPFSFPDTFGFQTIQSLYAIGSGGIFGLGLGQSRQKSFLPEPFNDFIFAIIAEELGLVGAGLVLFLFAFLIWRGIKIAMNATDTFGSLLAGGIVLMVATQVIINVGVTTNTIPNTGVSMPFISYGGTALVTTMFLMGVLLNISRYSKE